ncbi:hypothetical protein BaRGS_00023356 [Batillaria attramentaria]|uniref:Peptidase S1 domain-containing protein n=1 Tax=Batillaria attramentaria TaxID=370345 RepID=A0ABD0KE35_9CAEN
MPTQELDPPDNPSSVSSLQLTGIGSTAGNPLPVSSMQPKGIGSTGQLFISFTNTAYRIGSPGQPFVSFITAAYRNWINQSTFCQFRQRSLKELDQPGNSSSVSLITAYRIGSPGQPFISFTNAAYRYWTAFKYEFNLETVLPKSNSTLFDNSLP